MGYADASPIRGRGLVDEEGIQGWFENRAAWGAGYCGLPQIPIPDELGAAIVRQSNSAGLNSDLIAAQILKESAAAQSLIFREKYNPSGLGAINSDPMGGAIDFKSGDAKWGQGVEAGIHATVAHLLTYYYGKSNPWWNDDPRATAVEAEFLGTVKVLQDLDGKWARPGNGYGAGIATLANELVDFAQKQGGTMATADDQNAEWLPGSNFDPGRSGETIQYIILHTTEGGYDGSLNWLRGQPFSSNTESSAHYIASADGAKLAQIVREADTSWGAGNLTYNRRAVNIEQEGYADKGGFSDGLYSTVGQLVARIAARHNVPLEYTGKTGKPGIIGHMDVPNGSGGWGGASGHHDPGPQYDFGKLIAIAKGGQAAPPPPASDSRYFPETQHYLAHGFLAYWESHGDEALQLFGYPISEEFSEDGKTVQYLERARFEWAPGKGLPFDVQLGLVGSEDAKQARQSNPDAFAPTKAPD